MAALLVFLGCSNNSPNGCSNGDGSPVDLSGVRRPIHPASTGSSAVSTDDTIAGTNDGEVARTIAEISRRPDER